MAADSKVMVDEVSYSTRKLYRIGDSIVGCAGDNSAIFKFLEWLKQPTRKLRILKSETFTALVLRPDGLFRACNSSDFDEITDDCAAIGTGTQAALVAMRRFGSTPEQAVEAACAVDNNTGGPVLVYHLTEN